MICSISYSYLSSFKFSKEFIITSPLQTYEEKVLNISGFLLYIPSKVLKSLSLNNSKVFLFESLIISSEIFISSSGIGLTIYGLGISSLVLSSLIFTFFSGM